MPIAVTIAWLLLRETLRALAVPARSLWYLVTRERWEQLGRETLQQAPSPETDALQRFLAHRPAQPRNHVFVSAGETSGEMHAVQLIRATGRSGLDLRWSCFGGAAMRGEGGELLYPLSEHAVMGLLGVLKSIPFLVRGIARYLRMLRDDPPDLVVLVDYPGLHMVMGRLAVRRGIPVLHYIAPQHWAWAPWRLRRYRGCVDATLTILPFETEFFERFGLPAEYIGHPLLDHLAAHPADADEIAEVRARPTLCMLPGSRRAEIRAHMPAYILLAQRLRRDHPDLRFVIPHVDPRRADLVHTHLAQSNASDLIEVRVGPLAAQLQGARSVLAKSGTGTLEACLHGTPTVVVYKLPGRFWNWLYRTFLTVPWVSLPNLIAGRQIVDEHVFAGEEGWEGVEQSVRGVLADGEVREQMLTDLAEMRRRMGEAGASDRVARWVLEFFRPERGDAQNNHSSSAVADRSTSANDTHSPA